MKFASAVIALSVALCGPLTGKDFQVGENSVLAVITHKGGIAKGLAHNHFVMAGKYDVTISATSVEDLKLKVTIPVEALEADPVEASKKAFAQIKSLGLLDEPFGEVKEKDRAKIRKAMMGKSQLHLAEHTEITALLKGVTPKTSKMGDVTFSHELDVEINIKGVVAEKKIAANITLQDGKLTLQAVGKLLFSDFGIKPYSAMFGAISNKDEFNLMVYIEGS